MAVVEAAALERRGERARLAVMLGLLSAFGPLSLDTYLPSLPSLARDFHTSTATAQLTLTSCLVGLAVGQVIAGPISDARGRRGPLLVGLVAYVAATAVCAVAPDVYLLIAVRLVQGAAGAAGIVIARAVVRDHFSGMPAARMFGRLMMVNGLAPIIAPILGAQLLRVTSWRGVFVVLTAIGVALFVMALWGLPESLPVERRHTGGLRGTVGAFRGLLADRHYMGYAMSGGLMFAAMFAYISGSSFVLEESFGMSPQLFSVTFAVNACGAILFNRISNRLVGRFGPRRLLLAGLLVGAGGGVLLLVAVLAGLGLPGVLPALWLLVACTGLVMPNGTALALADYPHVAGSASALLGLNQFVLGAAAAPLVGIAGPHTAVPMAVVIAALSAGGVLVLRVLAHERGPRRN